MHFISQWDTRAKLSLQNKTCNWGVQMQEGLENLISAQWERSMLFELMRRLVGLWEVIRRS